MKTFNLYITTVKRKNKYRSGYHHECTEYEVYDGDDKILFIDSISLSNRNLKKGKYGVKQILDKKGYSDYNFDIKRFNFAKNY